MILQNRILLIPALLALGLTTAIVSPAQAVEPGLSFYPAKGWTLSAATENAPQGTPDCVLATQYNNGFLLRFDGAAGNIRSLHIDFRQPIFKPGQSYQATIATNTLTPVTLTAMAQGDHALSLLWPQSVDTASALGGATALDITVEENSFRFFTGALQDAMQRMTACMNSAAPQGTTQAATTAPERVLPDLTPPETSGTDVPAAPPENILQPQLVTDSDYKIETYRDPETNYKVTHEVYQAEADFTPLAPPPAATLADAEESFVAQAQARVDGDMARKISALEADIRNMKTENMVLKDELDAALSESQQERTAISSENWNLERATMRFNEAERQLKRLGQQLQRERAQCETEKKELEAMLFDPRVTTQQQLAQLVSLEEQLAKALEENENQRRIFEERIRILEEQGVN